MQKMLTPQQKARHLASLKTRMPRGQRTALVVNETNKLFQTFPLMTIRQIYYQLVAKNIIPNTSNYYGGMDDILVSARERGTIDWRHIVDRSRQVLEERDYDMINYNDFLTGLVGLFREGSKHWSISLWNDQPNRVFILLEKDSLSQLVYDLVKEFRIPVYVCHGYTSFTKMKELALRCDGSKHSVVILLSDYDPSGRDMKRDAKDRLARYGALDFEVKRIGITLNQILNKKLPYKPSAAIQPKLIHDPRAKKYGINHIVELDALSPSDLRSIVRGAVKHYMDKNAYLQWKSQMQKDQKALEQSLLNAKIEIDGKVYP